MSNRILYLDVAKSLAMLLVVFGHVIVDYDTRGYAAPCALAIYSFHTAFFMFMSGWFFSNALKKQYKTLIVEKSRQLLLPYFSWSIIMLIFLQIPEYGFDVFGSMSDFIKGGWLRNYWYLKLLFLYIILTYFSIKITRIKWIGCIVSFLLFTFLPNFSFSCVFIPFFLAAYLGRSFIDKHDGWRWIIGYALVAFVLYMFWKPSYSYTSVNMQFLPWLVRTLIGIDISCLLLLLLKKIFLFAPEKWKITQLLRYTGTITLGIYVSHFLFYKPVLWGWLINLLPSDHVLIYLIWAVVTFVLTTLLVTLIGKNRYLAFVFLGKKL